MNYMEHRFEGKHPCPLQQRTNDSNGTARWRKYTISCQEDFVAIRTTSSLLVHHQLETHTIRVYLLDNQPVDNWIIGPANWQ